MFELGKFNTLTASRVTPNGVYLVDDEQQEVLLPKKYIPADLRLQDNITVFLFKDSEDRLTATTVTPKILLNEYAALQVKDVAPFGAFMDWGLEKDLLVPLREQNDAMIIGSTHVVYLYHDKQTDRLVASTRLNRFLDLENISVEEGEEVDLLVIDYSDQGVNVVINSIHRGLIFKTDLFQQLKIGDQLKGYIKNIRPDKKIDIILRKAGYEGIEPGLQKILDLLKIKNGFLGLNDKSDPEEIKNLFGMSKKTFKKAIGSLYKQKKINIKEDGIYLL